MDMEKLFLCLSPGGTWGPGNGKEMTRRHLPWGWACGGLSGPELKAAAGPVSRPPAPSGLTTWLLSVGLFKISSMEKDNPSFLGAPQHPELFLSIPYRGLALVHSEGGCEEGQKGTLCVPRAMLVEGGVLPPLKLLESKGQVEVEHGGPHVRFSKHDSVSARTSMGYSKAPRVRKQITLGELEWAVSQARGLRALAGLMSRAPSLPRWVQLYCQGSSAGWSLSKSPGKLESLRSPSVGTKAKSWKEEDSPPSPFLWLVALACWLWSASGRLECHLGAPGGQL